MKIPIIGILLIFLFILLTGCVEEKTPTSYFEIVIDENNFHEIIIVPSGEVFEKIGKSNLDLENQVKTFTIQKEIATNLFNKSKELAKNGTDCEYGPKEIILFENNTVQKICFDSNEFDSFFNEIIEKLTLSKVTDNYFVHLITYDEKGVIDRHLHSNGLLISTFHTGNTMTSASMKTLTVEKVNQLKQLTNAQVLLKETLCTPIESNYNYIEIQKDDKYTYYYNCQKNNTNKISFFTNALQILGE